MNERRLKHWGWGYEDQAPSGKELEEAAAGIRARFGFGGEVESPVPLDAGGGSGIRLKAPADLGDLFVDEKVRAGQSGARQGLSRRGARFPRGIRESTRSRRSAQGRVGDRDRALSWAEAEGAAVIPFGGGTSVVGGIEGRLGDRPFVSLDLRRLDRVLEVDAESMAARIQAGATGPRLEEQLREHGLTLRHFPQCVRVRDSRRLDRDPGRGALRHSLHAHRRPGRVGAGDHAARDLGEPAAAGLGGGPVAGPGADRLGGNPRRDRRGLDAGAAAARVQGLLRGRVRRLPRRGGRRARDLAVGPLPEQLPPARRDGGGHDRRRQRREEPAGPRLRVGPPPRGRADGAGPGDRPGARRHCGGDASCESLRRDGGGGGGARG